MNKLWPRKTRGSGHVALKGKKQEAVKEGSFLDTKCELGPPNGREKSLIKLESKEEKHIYLLSKKDFDSNNIIVRLKSTSKNGPFWNIHVPCYKRVPKVAS